jgi:hypothetical protein
VRAAWEEGEERRTQVEPVLVVVADERATTRLLAELVTEGVRVAGFEPLLVPAEKVPADLSPYRLVFLGYQAPLLFHQPLSRFLQTRGPSLRGRTLALFHSYSARYGRYFFRKLVRRLSSLGCEPKFTLSLRRRGWWAFIGGGWLAEEDLARAKAFGERTSNTAYGVRVRKESEKARIKGYQKPAGPKPPLAS